MRPDEFSQLLGFSGDTITAISSAGGVYRIGATAHDIQSTSVKSDSSYRVMASSWPRSPDGARIYVGYGHLPERYTSMAAADEFRVFDSATWQPLGQVRTSVPFLGAAASNDGRFLYAAAPDRHRLLVIDAIALRQTASFRLGNNPMLVLVAP